MSLTIVIKKLKTASFLKLGNIILLVLAIILLFSTIIIEILGIIGITFLVFSIIFISISIVQLLLTYIDMRKDIDILDRSFKKSLKSEKLKTFIESKERAVDIPIPPKLPPKCPKVSLKEDIGHFEDLSAPEVPEPPKRKAKINLKLNEKMMNDLLNSEDNKEKVVLVDCEICKEVIPITIQKSMVLDSELPIVPISYVHKTKKKKNQHCITVYLDHDFDVRRQRVSEVIISIEES